MRPRCTDPLTPCELEITQLVACGISDKEIADRTHRSIKTVSNTLKNIYEKHGIQGRHALTSFYHVVYHGLSVDDFDVIGNIRRSVSAIIFTLFVAFQAIAIHDDNAMRARRNARRGRHDYELTINQIEA